jgi:hypothetical protein
MDIVQLEPAVNDVLHVLVCANLAALLPESATAMPVIVAVPVFVSVTACAAVVIESVASVNVSAAGASVATGAAMPLSPTVCGDPLTLSAILSVAASVPLLPPGAKLTDTLQDAPTARLLPQSFVCAKLEAFVPVIDTPLILTAMAPVFVTVTG